MKKYPYRLLIIAEEIDASSKVKLNNALDKIRQDFEVVEGWGFETRIAYVDKIEGEWVPNKYVDIIFDTHRVGHIAKETKRKYGGEFHSVCLLFKEENWGAGRTYGGLNIGGLFSGMSAQLSRWYDREDWIYQVLVEEVAHCIDEHIYKETGVVLENYLNLPAGVDVDDAVIHGEHPDYERKKYRPFFKQIAPLLIQAFKKKDERWQKEKKVMSIKEQILSILQALLPLYRQLIRKKKPVKGRK